MIYYFPGTSTLMLQVLQVMHVLPVMLRSRAAVGSGNSSSMDDG
jgi:hypothetical protein